MLAATPRLAALPIKQVVASSLNQCIEQMAKGCTNAFAKLVDIPRPTVGKWRAGNQAPVLGAILRVCFKVGVSLLDFLIGECFEVRGLNIKGTKVSNREPKQAQETHQRRDITSEEAKSIRSTLRKALKANPPQCLKEVAQKVGRNPNSIQYRFPDLCAPLIARYADYEMATRQELGRQMSYALEEAVKGEDPPHSLAEFARSHGWSHKILRHRFPKQCRALTRRCAEERNEKWISLKQALEAALTENPAQSVYEFARRYNVHTGTLYRRFPDLCRRLSRLHAQG